MLCTWLIEAPPGYYVQLHIYDFNLEYGGNNCPWDYLAIYDGTTVSSSLITKACGYLSSFTLYSSGRFLFLQFYSDSIIPMSGFSAWCSITSYYNCECHTFVCCFSVTASGFYRSLSLSLSLSLTSSFLVSYHCQYHCYCH